MPHERRTYRRLSRPEGLVSSSVRLGETNLQILAARDVTDAARELARSARAELHAWRRRDPELFETLEPLGEPLPEDAPGIVRAMARAGELAGVGPMAAVAGAVAERVGRGLLAGSPDAPPLDEVIVENGGDVFMATREPRRVAIFAGESPLSMKLSIEIAPGDTPVGCCTSSATVGPSVNFGAADAAVVIAPGAALADACATALGNRVRSRGDLEKALEWVLGVGDGGTKVRGALVILGETFAAQGEVKVAAVADGGA